MTGIERVAEARALQLRGKHTIPQDVTDHAPGDIARAVAHLAEWASAVLDPLDDPEDRVPTRWPWSDDSWRELTSRGSLYALAHAGALCAAEIDRTEAVARIV